MRREQKAGLILMSPPVLLLIAGFLLPLAFVAYTSLMPPRTFGLTSDLTFENYVTVGAQALSAPAAPAGVLSAIGPGPRRTGVVERNGIRPDLEDGGVHPCGVDRAYGGLNFGIVFS